MPGLSQIGFGGGLAQGLANALSRKRGDDEKKRQEQIQGIWKSISFLMDSGQVQDIATLQPHFDSLAQLGAFGPIQKGGKKGELGPQDHVTNILGRIIDTQKPKMGPMAQQGAAPAPGPDDAGNVQPDTSLPAQPFGSTGEPAPQRMLRMGDQS